MVTLIFGGLMWRAQGTLSDLGVRLYDDAFTSMDHLRAAQHAVLSLSRHVASADASTAEVTDLLDDAMAEVGAAQERALSAHGRDAMARLSAELAQIRSDYRQTHLVPRWTRLTQLEAQLDHAVELNAGDGFRSRRLADVVISHIAMQTWIAMGVSVLVATIITVVLSRAIVPAVKHAVGIATAIADGKLDNQIESRGRDETSLLLKSLASMQSSLAARMRQIHQLMEDRASSQANEIAAERMKFETALENMIQGLCMFDAGGQILVANRRFADMFGPAQPGDNLRAIVPEALLCHLAGPSSANEETHSLSQALDDGRTITVLQRPMDGGGWVATFEDVTEQQKAEERIEHLARHDPLTGLPNRIMYLEQTELMAAQLSSDGVLAVCCVGLDRFKSINDTFGHDVGDMVLGAVGERLQGAIRRGDMVARIGGDEFAVVSNARHVGEVRIVGERLLKVLGAPLAIGPQRLTVGASIGIAAVSSTAEPAEVILQHAELALSKAKSAGGGDLRFFDAAMDAQAISRRRMKLDLKTAVAQGQFKVFYEPEIRLCDRQIAGFGATLRWHHPENGLLTPRDFMAVAEEVGLSIDIGLHMLHRACADASGWPDSAVVAVNLPAPLFRDPSIVGSVRNILEQSGLPAQRLEIKVTESLLLQDNSSVLPLLKALQGLGASIAMDDFGTGYSSLGCLNRFAFSKIHIDQSFIDCLTDTTESLAIIRAVISIGKSLGMSVVAEGVSTESQLALLVREGCDFAQGRIFGDLRAASEIAPALIGAA